MLFGSLKLRSLALSALSIGGALVFCWFLLTALFERQIADRFFAELEPHLQQLAAVIEPADAGVEVVGGLTDPRFERPFSGLYWQIGVLTGPAVEDGRGDRLTSRSLWDDTLELPPTDASSGDLVRHDRVPFQDASLIALERTLLIGEPQAEMAVRTVVALDRSEMEGAIRAFGGDVLLLVALLGAFLLIAAAAQIVIGLRPLSTLRSRLNEVRAGATARLDGKYPSEVQQLVGELNALLGAREEIVTRARQRASDLAHGLKTPLAVLAAEGRRLDAAGANAAAAEIALQIDRMNRSVERELARARARGAGSGLEARTPVGPAIDRLVSAFERLPGGELLQWQRDVGPEVSIAMDPVDFDEVAGNLLDNARKWAAGRVGISAEARDGEVSVVIEDDGPGVPAEKLGEVLERGQRLDQTAPGSGLGLAIARDILELYRGGLVLEAAAPGGLRVRMIVPDPAG